MDQKNPRQQIFKKELQKFQILNKIFFSWIKESNFQEL